MQRPYTLPTAGREKGVAAATVEGAFSGTAYGSLELVTLLVVHETGMLSGVMAC